MTSFTAFTKHGWKTSYYMEKNLELKPPDDLDTEALAEWHRVIANVQATNRQRKAADVSILSAYCRTWSIHRQCFEHIRKYGPVIKWSNGTPGQSPQYKTFRECTTLL